MKEERMAIFGMLEKGIITVEEAERLLFALQEHSENNRDGLGVAINGALSKAGNALNSLTKVLGDKAEDLEPKVKQARDKFSEKAAVIVEDAKNYAQKLKEKREQQEAQWYDLEDEDLTDEDLSDVRSYFQEHDSQEEDTDIEDTQDAQNTDGEEADEALDESMKSIETYMNTIQAQLDEINDAESFLKNAFGVTEEEMMAWDEEDEEEDPEKAEVEKEKPVDNPNNIETIPSNEETKSKDDEDTKEK